MGFTTHENRMLLMMGCSDASTKHLQDVFTRRIQDTVVGARLLVQATGSLRGYSKMEILCLNFSESSTPLLSGHITPR